MSQKPPPLLGIAAYSGTGKTTLLKILIPLLQQRKIRVGLIKHTHHNMEIDILGKDSYELRKTGESMKNCGAIAFYAAMADACSRRISLNTKNLVHHKPEPPKFPLLWFQVCDKLIPVDKFIATLKGIMTVQQNMPPGHR
jgi:Molybdopterin guanine dinucleotide synthesis protein B